MFAPYSPAGKVMAVALITIVGMDSLIAMVSILLVSMVRYVVLIQYLIADSQEMNVLDAVDAKSK